MITNEMRNAAKNLRHSSARPVIMNWEEAIALADAIENWARELDRMPTPCADILPFKPRVISNGDDR
jgi:hypothetical protein